jgi:hypothetical protein
MGRSRIAGFFILLVIAGCAAGSGGSPEASSRGDRNYIPNDELRTLEPMSAYEAVRRLRPHWLIARTPGEVQVHLDETRFGEAVSLQRISADQVREMRYMSASDATTRFGTGYPNGVILVVTR